MSGIPQDPPSDQSESMTPTTNRQQDNQPPSNNKKRQKNAPPKEKSDAIPNLLLKLLEACAKHKRRHENDRQATREETTSPSADDSDRKSKSKTDNIKKCQEELHALSRVLPRVEPCIVVRDTQFDEYHFEHLGEDNDNVGAEHDYEGKEENRGKSMRTMPINPLDYKNDEDDVRHLCALYRAIARGAFCPHAALYLFGGGGDSSQDEKNRKGPIEQKFDMHDIGIVKGILPRIARLLGYLAMDPVRVALLSFMNKSESKSPVPSEEAIKTYFQEEDIGATIAALLNLLEDEGLRMLAVNDLITLSNDLNTIEESQVLFDPSFSYVEIENANETMDQESHQRQGKVKVHIFTELSDYLRKRSNDIDGGAYVIDDVLTISSRRSLLAIQLGTWTALHHLIPLVLFRQLGSSLQDDDQVSSRLSDGCDNKAGLLASLMSSARPALMLSPRPESDHTPLISFWRYSYFDSNVHSLIILQTKLMVVGLFTSILSRTNGLPASLGSFEHIFQMDSKALVPSVKISLLSVETAKSHLAWNRATPSSSLKVEQMQSKRGTENVYPIDIEHELNLWCSRGISNLVIFAVLFPDHAPQARDDILSHCCPYIIDCIPFIGNPSKKSSVEEKCLSWVILRVLHATLFQNTKAESHISVPHISYPSNAPSTFHVEQHTTSAKTSEIDLFRHRCLVRGYFPYLFQLTKDSSESISGPSISIIVCLLETSQDSCISDFESSSTQHDFCPSYLVENACRLSLDYFDSTNSVDGEGRREDYNDFLKLGSKRRRLRNSLVKSDHMDIDDETGHQHLRQSPSDDTSVLSALIHSIIDALAASQHIIKQIDENGANRTEDIEGPKVVSLISDQDMIVFRGVAGTLRILLSVCKTHWANMSETSPVGGVVKHLFRCVQTVSDMLTNQKCENGDLCYLEPQVLKEALETIVSVGLHSCRVSGNSTEQDVENLLPRESISNCAIAALSLFDDDQIIEPDDCKSTSMIPHSNRKRYCRNMCSRLCSAIGLFSRQYAGICLCRLAGVPNKRLARECEDFTFDDTLPLKSRCVLLATFFPVASDGMQYDQTIASIRCILGNPSHHTIMTTSLVSLANLFISLAIRKHGHSASSARYLVILMNSFSFKELVIHHAFSKVAANSYAAYSSLARLATLYKTASIVASEETGICVNNQRRVVSSYLWNKSNHRVRGMSCVLLDSMSMDDHTFLTSVKGGDLHQDLIIPLVSKEEFSNLPSVGENPFSIQLAKFLYIQSTVALTSMETLRSSNTNNFFKDDRHFVIYDKLAEELNQVEDKRTTVVTMIPPPILLLITPFLGCDTTTQVLAARHIGPALFNDDCKLFSAFFIPEKDMAEDVGRVSNEIAKRAVGILFREIDYLLSRFCGVSWDLLFSNEAGSFRSDSPPVQTSHISVSMTAIDVFQSLCQFSPLELTIGRRTFQRSLLGLLRIWVASSGGRVFDAEISGDGINNASSLASSAFDRLHRIFLGRRDPIDSSLSKDLLKNVHHIMPKILSEFFLPPAQETISPRTRYRLLTLFIETFLLPSKKILRIPAQNGLEVTNVIEIIGFIDQVLPPVIANYIEDEDYEALQMCAAFRIYLISEAKKLTKEEKRSQKRNINEFVVGTLSTRTRTASSARSLVPGVTISTKKLMENTKLLCVKSEVIEYVLPRLLLHPSRGPLKFFTAKICQSEVNLSEILRQKELTVLKKLVWELGGDDPEEDREEEMFGSAVLENSLERRVVLLALSKGVLLKNEQESSESTSLSNPTTDLRSTRSWIAPNFMYLLVNIVLYKWNTKSDCERFQSIKCLRAMLQFLPPVDSPRYMPQIMSAINNAMSFSVISDTTTYAKYHSKLSFVAVATLFDFIKVVASHDASELGDNLTSIVVTLFPLFNTFDNSDSGRDFAREKAVEMLEWLARGAGSDKLPSYFNEVPFLPMTHDLEQTRQILGKSGVHLDDVQLLSQQTTQRTNHQKAAEDGQLQAKFFSRMNVLSELVSSHESKSVRKVVLEHMTDLIKANRGLFQNLVENEELASMHFLTVVHGSSSSKHNRQGGGDKTVASLNSSASDYAQADEASVNGGFVTKLLMRLLSRCVDESDHDLRDVIASCLGEIGAIDPNRLGNEINSSQVASESQGTHDNEWRLSQPPWKSPVTRYQLRLVTRHLVTCLKSSPTTLDQHKISFAIQELLKLLDSSSKFECGKNLDGEALGPSKNPMTPWLKERLDEADVMNIVEPFWTTNYKQADTAAAKLPPFFVKSSTYFSWLSSFCRFLITRSNSNKKSMWRPFFYACRSAIRSQAGISVAEFLFPFLLLDAVCFGDKQDENVIASELIDALSFEKAGPDKNITVMNLREREKAANAVFTVMDVLRHWVDHEIEQRHETSRNRSKRTSNQPNHKNGEPVWPADLSIVRIERLVKRISFSSCAVAASKVGMNARALQFLEVGSRSLKENSIDIVTYGNANGAAGNDLKFLKSYFIDGIDLQLTQRLLGKLNDFDTMLIVAQKNQQSELSTRLCQEATEREMYGDWEGALQAYEQLLDSRLSKEDYSGLGTPVDLNKRSAQKGLLRCLLKLGRLDSVLNQAYGMSKQNLNETTVQVCDELLPSATEAAWRLGKWDILDKLVNRLDDEATFDANSRYQITLGRTIHALHSRSPENVVSCLREARECVMSSLSSAARDSYTRSYPYLMQLHVLREVEYVSSVFFNNPSQLQQSFVEFVSSDEWQDRMSLTTPDITGSNAIINTRLALSRMANEPAIEGSMWLGIGKMSRKGGLYQVAEHSLAQADVSFCNALSESMPTNDRMVSLVHESIGNVKLQFAKLKHAIGESTTALKIIEDNIPDSVFQMNDEELESFITAIHRNTSSNPGNMTSESREIISRRILQATEWMVCDGLRSGTEIKSRYQTVLKLAPNWERAHFHFAKYLDSLLESRISALCELKSRQGTENDANRIAAIYEDEPCQKYLRDSVSHYGISLQLGQKHVYQALPRLIAMWLEFTSVEAVQDCDEMDKKELKRNAIDAARLHQNQELINKLIKSFVDSIPEHLFYTALPQLISCVVHNNAETSKNVVSILKAVLAKYPGQAMWSCGWLRQSKSDLKNKAGDEIFNGAQKILRKSDPRGLMQGVLKASHNLFQFLIGLAKYAPRENHSSVKMKVPKFETELKHFIPPIQAALSVTPSALDRSSFKDVFPSFVPRMRAFNPELRIMQSKAKPKKISIFAVPSTVAQRDSLTGAGHAIPQDTGEMHFLVKQEKKGDLRKDSRVQDLNNVINRLFVSRKGSSGPNSRRQRLRLHLRTFSVVCLAEDCGILEWVPNTESLRSLVSGTYNPQVAPDSIHRRGFRLANFNDPDLRTAFQKCQDLFFEKGNLILASKKFDECILKQYLPVMYWWFIQNFSNPHAWFEARTNFTLSAAVWSAVGHVIGLGDRHSENILIDTSNGECVHVDFDCIFDKGLYLPRPEVIPFRLTPNMLDSFGPCGADGLYTGALIESMKTLRNNRDTLLSVLEPFLKDPVINFQNNKSSQSKSSGQEKLSGDKDAKSAKRSVNIIDGRLKGVYNLRNPNMKKVKRQDGYSPDEDDISHITQLSVEGQVQKMIMEATSHENLVQVYVGWMPWI